MSLVSAKCPNCGASIEVDPTQKADICKYCNTAFITEKAINPTSVNFGHTIIQNYYGETREQRHKPEKPPKPPKPPMSKERKKAFLFLWSFIGTITLTVTLVLTLSLV